MMPNIIHVHSSIHSFILSSSHNQYANPLLRHVTISSCSGDFVAITELDLTFCNLQRPPTTPIVAPRLSLKFHTDAAIGGKGFSVTYRTGQSHLLLTLCLLFAFPLLFYVFIAFLSAFSLSKGFHGPQRHHLSTQFPIRIASSIQMHLPNCGGTAPSGAHSIRSDRHEHGLQHMLLSA